MLYRNPNKSLVDHQVRIRYTGIEDSNSNKITIVSIENPIFDGVNLHKTTGIEILVDKLKHELVTMILKSPGFIVSENVFEQESYDYVLDKSYKLITFQEIIEFSTSETPDGNHLVYSLWMPKCFNSFFNPESYSEEERKAIHNIMVILDNLYYLEFEARQHEATKDTRS